MKKNRWKFWKIAIFSPIILPGISFLTFSTNFEPYKSTIESEIINKQNFDIRTYEYLNNQNALPKYDNTFGSPDYNLIYSNVVENPTQVNVDANGWATANNTYRQVFLNDQVAAFFSNNNVDSNFDINVAKSNLTNVQNTMNFEHFYDLNNDPFNIYADDTIKCLNNPNLKDLWNQVQEINLSNNDLWYLPLLGYQSSQTSNAASFYNELNKLDLSNNKLTLLPFAKIQGLIRTSYYDLTQLPKLQENSILLSGNLICEDPRIDPQVTESLYRPPVNNPNKLAYESQQQSSWIYVNSTRFSNYINYYYEVNNSRQIKDLYLKQKDIGVDQEITVGQQITSLLTKWLQDNYLCSNFLFGQDQSQLSFLSSDVYLFSQINNEKGMQMFSTYFKNMQYFDIEKQELNVNNNVYINFNVLGFKKDNAVEISVLIILILLIVLLIVILMYQLFLKKYLIDKKKAKIAKELSEIQNILSDTRKDAK